MSTKEWKIKTSQKCSTFIVHLLEVLKNSKLQNTQEY